MSDQRRDPLSGPFGAVLKFIGAALFGCLVSLVVLAIGFVTLDADVFLNLEGRFFHALWIIPLVWGVLGVFWFHRMLGLARRIFEAVFARRRW